MKIIVPTNNKGGIGKTKVSILLAEYFSKIKNQRVLAIDFDPQCNFSRRYLKMEIDPNATQGYRPPIHPQYNPNDPEDSNWDGYSSIGDIFFGKLVFPYQTHIPNLDIAPAHADQLLAAESQTRSEIESRVHRQLHLFLNDQALQEEYDVVIVDTAPSKGPLTVSAIKAATHIIIPSLMEPQPIQGIYGMLQLWMQESLNREVGRPLELVGILPNMFRQINLHRDMLDGLKKNPAVSKYIFPFNLGQRVAFAEVDADDASPKSIFDLPEGDIAKLEAMAVCDFVEKRVFNYE